jgi:RHS repeat-associated protein
VRLPINTYTWRYDSLSRITSQGSIDGSSTYTYDETSQLVAANYSAGAGLPTVPPDEGYNYDANGNRTSTGYQTGANNQLLSDGTFTYQYDAEGNRITRTRISTDPADDYLTEYTWDHRNRLTSVTLKNNSDEVTARVEYDYDVFNLMVARREYADESSTPIKSEHFIYDGSQIVLVFQDLDPSGSQPSALHSRPLLGPAVDQIFAAEDDLGDVIWPLADHLNTARDFADSSGALLNHRQFDSFGNLTAESSPTATDYHFTFTGGYQDALTGLVYRWNRWYETETGRWIAEDPLGFVGGDSNIYRYVGNDTLGYTDASGLSRVGHHFVPQSIYKLFAYLLDSDAIEVFKCATADPELYNHGFDTWLGKSHDQYNEAVGKLLQEYKRLYSPHGRVTGKQASNFLEFLQGGQELSNLSHMTNEVSTVRTWLKGFYLSIAHAETLTAIAPHLSKAEVKAYVRQIVNGGKKLDDFSELAPYLNAWRASSAASKATRLGRVLKIAGPALVAFSVLQSANTAVACEGPLADRIEDQPLAYKILSQVGYDAVFGEDVEAIMFPAVRSWADFLAGFFGITGNRLNNNRAGMSFDDSGRLR